MTAGRIPSLQRVALAALVVLLGADIVGVVISFVLDVAPVRHKSTGLGYAIWLVLGVFAGIIHYGAAAGDRLAQGWNTRAEARSAGVTILGTTVAVVVGLLALFYVSMWRHAGGPEWAVVPDHLPTTLVFLAAFVLASTIAHHASTPDAPGASA